MPVASTSPDDARARDAFAWVGLTALMAVIVLMPLLQPTGSDFGDFSAFYGAGRIVLDGDGSELYNLERQATAQRDLPAATTKVFSYPPVVAVAHAGIAWLPYPVAKAVHGAAMAGLLFLAFLIVRPLLPATRPRDPWILLAVMSWLPVLAAVGGGQNTSVSIIILALVWRSLETGRDRRLGWAAGLMLFKPQFGAPLAGLAGLARRAAVPTLALTTFVWWAIGALVTGPRWVQDWVTFSLEFTAQDQAAAGGDAISWRGIVGSLTLPTPIEYVLAATLVALTFVVAALVWRKNPNPSLMVAIAAPAIVLCSPHSIYYDAGLLALSVAGLASHLPRRVIALGAGALWALGVAQPVLAATTHVAPLALGVVVAFCAAAWAALRAPSEGDDKSVRLLNRRP